MRHPAVLRFATRAIAIAALGLASLPAPASAQTATPTPASATAKARAKPYQMHPAVTALGQLMSGYYRKPTPDLVPEVLKAFFAAPDTPAHIIATSEAFVAGLIAVDPGYVGRVIPIYAEQPEAIALGLARAMLLSGHKDSGKLIENLKSSWREKAEAITALTKAGVPVVTAIEPLSHGGSIDLNWAYYGATGSRKAVETIISALYGVQDIGDPIKLTTGYSAKWSLAAEAMRDKNVADICKSHLPGPHRVALQDILKAVEDGDSDRIGAEARAMVQKHSGPKPKS